MGYKKFTKTPQTDFVFLKHMGLKPNHKILDIGCGGGRLGYELINYLNDGNYYAFDKESNWINDFKFEVEKSGLSTKNPTIFMSDFNLKFEKDVMFDYAYAYSVFTHVGPELIELFLSNLKSHFHKNSILYATIIQGSKNKFEYNRIHPERPNEYLQARYDFTYIKDLIGDCGYICEYIPETYNQRIGPGNHEDANLSPEHKVLSIRLV